MAIEESDAFILVAERKNRAVAWAVVHTKYRQNMGWYADGKTPTYQDGENAYLEYVEVAEPLRRQGIGGKLLKAVEKEAKKYEKRLLWLHTNDRNIGAQRFYERHGWAHIITIAAPWAQGIPVRVYCQQLG